MKEATGKSRKALEAKFANVFEEQISSLSTKLRDILLDDMVTAFENRLYVLNHAIDKTAK